MSDRLRRLTLACSLAISAWVSTSKATDAVIPAYREATTTEQPFLAPAGLDETTLELFVTAVADLHKTATHLGQRLTRLESLVRESQARNRSLDEENARLRKVLRLQSAVPAASWHSHPLDQEVRAANDMLEGLVTTLTGLAPAE